MGATLPPGGIGWLLQAHDGDQRHRWACLEAGGPLVALANGVTVRCARRLAPVGCYFPERVTGVQIVWVPASVPP